MDQVVAWVDPMVTPAGGQVRGDVAGRTVHVRAAQPQQERVAKLLEEAVRRLHRQITLETRLVWIPQEVEQALPDALADQLAAARDPVASARGCPLSDDDLQTLLAAVQHAEGATTLVSPRITTFDGQRAYVVVGTSRAIISGYQRDPAGAGADAWKPQVENVQSGEVLDARCRTSAGTGKAIAIMCSSQVNRLLDLQREAFTPNDPADIAGIAAARDAHLEIDKPVVQSNRFEGLISVEDGQPVVFYLPTTVSPADAKTGTENGARCYMLLTAKASRLP